MHPRTQPRQLVRLARTYATPSSAPITHSPHGSPSRPSQPSASSSSQASLKNASSSSTTKPRVYTERKQFLFGYYSYLLSRSPLFLLYEHENLATTEMDRLRNLIKKIPVPSSASPLSFLTSTTLPPDEQTPQLVPPVGERALVTVARTGLFAALARSNQDAALLEPWLIGQRAIITCPTLSPPYLAQLFQAIDKTIKGSPKATNAKPPKLKLIVGIIEGRLMPATQVQEIAKLPDVGVLRSQLVGMLEGNGRNLLGALSQAGGGGLVRTLQGLEKSMKEGGEAKAE